MPRWKSASGQRRTLHGAATFLDWKGRRAPTGGRNPGPPQGPPKCLQQGGLNGRGQDAASPNILRLDEPRAKAKLDHLIWIGWTSTGDPSQVVVVVYQQKFSVITSMFYGEEAPEDFSALPP
ncbi:MAG: hypothetical protein HYT80_08445 [Euryarchaeota archaeon]|nr:hypothetical protein [Euryarchaeota archaeon]